MTNSNIKILLENDPDFIALKRFEFSLDKLIDRYPDGCPSHVIAGALGITEEAVEVMYQDIIQKLRITMKV